MKGMIKVSILPPLNRQKKVRRIPRNFFIFGDTMSGKSYLAERFPVPLFLNTDGNSEMIPAQDIQLSNVRDAQGKLKRSVIDQLDEIILELKTRNPGYKTIVIDVIDDLTVMIEQAICYENDVQSLADIPYGKGYSAFNSVLQSFVVELKSLPMNVVYISRVAKEGDSDVEVPSLKTKYYNIVNGNCDLVIQTKRRGKNYIRRVTDRRTHYVREEIDDKDILRIRDNVVGVFDKPVKTPIKEQKKIVDKIETEKEVKEGKE